MNTQDQYSIAVTESQILWEVAPENNDNKEVEFKLRSFSIDDLGNAQALVYLYGDRIINVKGYGIVVWKNGVWDLLGTDAYLQDFIVSVLNIRKQIAQVDLDEVDIKLQSGLTEHEQKIFKAKKQVLTVMIGSFAANTNKIQSIKTFLKSYAPLLVSKNFFVDNQHGEEHMLPVPNGIIDGRTLELLPHDPKYNYTALAETKWNPEADYADWENQLKATVGYYELEHVAKYVKMQSGYMISGSSIMEKATALLGPRRAGKGTYTTAIEEVLGDDMSTSLDYSVLSPKGRSSQNFEVFNLLAKRFCAISEPARTMQLDAGFIKSLTGNDKIQAAGKGSNSISFRNTAKLVFGSNFDLKLPVEDSAAWDRFITIPFPNSFAESNTVDTTIKEKFSNDEATKEGVLRWLMEGYNMFYHATHEDRKTPQEFIDYALNMRESADPVNRFLEDCNFELTNNNSDSIPNLEVYQAYKKWAEDNDETVWTKTTFLDHLGGKKGIINKDKQIKKNGKNVRCVVGIRITDDF